jgi:hypothetical protein
LGRPVVNGAAGSKTDFKQYDAVQLNSNDENALFGVAFRFMRPYSDTSS